MNIFDVGIILLFVMFFIVGFKNGVIKELVALIGIILMFILSYMLKGQIGDLLCIYFPFIKFAGKIEGLTTMNIVLYQMIAFIIIFGILLSIYDFLLIATKALDKIVKLTVILILPSKILGGIVSVIKGYIILFAVFIVLMIPLGSQEVFYESAIINTILYKTPILSTATSKFTSAVTEIYDLGESISKDKISIKDANLKSLDIILKYNITSKETVEKLINAKKLDNINNVEDVLNNY